MDREKSVLVIDDEKAVFLKAMLPAYGIKNVLTASDKGEAVKAIDAIDFDLIVLELDMLYGIEILKYIKDKRPKTKVFIFSRCDYGVKKEAEKIGIDEFLPKSVQIMMVLNAVQYLLNP